MNEAVAISRLASKLLQDLRDIDNTCDDDSAIHQRAIEIILDSYERLEYIISQRPKEDGTEAQPEPEDPGTVN